MPISAPLRDLSPYLTGTQPGESYLAGWLLWLVSLRRFPSGSLCGPGGGGAGAIT